MVEKLGLYVRGSFPYRPTLELGRAGHARASLLSGGDGDADCAEDVNFAPTCISKFLALRKLTHDMTSGVPFTREVQNRTREAQQCFHILGKLSLNSCMLWPAKIGRSPLANTVGRLFQNL